MRMRLLRTVAPEAGKFIEEIAHEYKEKFNRPLRLVALVRSMDYQIALNKNNPGNSRVIGADALPSHVSGYAFDIAYKQMTAEEQNFLMQKLADDEKAGKIDALRESGTFGADAVAFHVFVYFNGKPPKI